MARAKLAQYHLLERAGAGVGLERENAGENVPARDDVADAQRRRDRFGKRTDVDDAAALAHGVERRRPPAVPDEVGVAIILENRYVVLFRQAQQLVTALLAQDRAGRILHGRDGVDVFGADAAALEVVKRGGHGVGPHAVAVERDAHGVDAQSREPRQRALIAFLLDEDGVSARKQRAVDEVERLQRAGGDEDFVGRAGDARGALELVRQELPQRTVAERPALEAVGRKRRAFALEHRGRGRNETIDRNVVGIVVAAGKIVFGKPGP